MSPSRLLQLLSFLLGLVRADARGRCEREPGSREIQQNETFVGEPLLDQVRWQDERILSVYLQTAPKTPGAPSRLRVIDFTSSLL